jgi:hypothetical protein
MKSVGIAGWCADFIKSAPDRIHGVGQRQPETTDLGQRHHRRHQQATASAGDEANLKTAPDIEGAKVGKAAAVWKESPTPVHLRCLIFAATVVFPSFLNHLQPFFIGRRNILPAQPDATTMQKYF